MDRVACTPGQAERLKPQRIATARQHLLTAGAVALSMYSAACASTGAVPHPFPAPAGATARRTPPPEPSPMTAPDATPSPAPAPIPTPQPAPSDNAARRSVVDGYALAGTALALRGTPYRNGGSDPSGFDCSGFTQYVFAQYGVSLPREVREQYRVGTPVNAEELAAGDVVFFSTTDPGPSHVAIVIGGDQFVHAPSSSGVVRVEHLSSSYWAPRFLGARRMN